MKNFSIICVALIICFSSACKKPVVPQLPSNKGNIADSADFYFAQLNSEIITHYDSILSDFVEHNYPDLKKTNDGFWYKIISGKSGKKIVKTDTVLVRYELYDLNNQHIKSEKFVAYFGKKQMTTALEQGLLLMHSGDSAVFVVPWYLAFGIKGNANIKPYTSVIYKVFVK
ncbi:MAG: FKBP-type peptidyl-prolyl cis-trans isomerase [Paludibacter sp.]|nr:FKBP-type peptidyl-prolyl cis-trans isomerase [Paludibacter sp.]